MRRNSCRSQPPVGAPCSSRPSNVYQNTCPKAVASGPKAGWTPSGKEASRQAVELFENAGARPIEIDFFGKNHIDARKAEHRRAADRLDARHAQKSRGQRISHLIFHVLRRATRPLAEDDLLIIAEVWDRIYGHGVARQPCELPSKGSDRKAPSHEADQG